MQQRTAIAMPVFEVAEFDINPGEEAAFERSVGAAVPLFRRAYGFRSLALHRVVEQPSTYRLVVGWETIESHTVDFRNSDDYQAWRRLVGHHFATTPRVVHLQDVVLDPTATS